MDKIIELLKSDDHDIVLSNMSLRRRIFWLDGEWLGYQGDKKISSLKTDSLLVALEWLKGEE